MQELHFLWTAPIEAAALLILLSTLVKVWILPAVALVLAMLAAQYFFGYHIAKNKYKRQKHTSARCVLVSLQIDHDRRVFAYAAHIFSVTQLPLHVAWCTCVICVRCLSSMNHSKMAPAS